MRYAVVGALFASLLFSPQAFAAAFSSHATDAVTVPTTPIGAPDSKTIVCRVSQPTASGQIGPQSCGPNNEWWNLAMSGKDLAADGKTLVDRPTVANPTGEGDPDAVTCRTSKLAMHGPICQTNRFWADLIKNHQTIDKPTVDNPTGEGDPDAVTCRTPKFAMRGPLVENCQTNRSWAAGIKKHQSVDADGAVPRRHSPVDYGTPYVPSYTGPGADPGYASAGSRR
jgi:hypothetical protein